MKPHVYFTVWLIPCYVISEVYHGIHKINVFARDLKNNHFNLMPNRYQYQRFWPHRNKFVIVMNTRRKSRDIKSYLWRYIVDVYGTWIPNIFVILQKRCKTWLFQIIMCCSVFSAFYHFCVFTIFNYLL